MVNTLISTILVGLAITFCIEFVDNIGFFLRRTLNFVMPVPLSVLGFYSLHELNLKLVVAIPAACFIALYLGALINKPVQVTNTRRY